MNLTTSQTDRAAGVLVGQAIGDALGVPYEFGSTRFDADAGPRMIGGGLGSYAPGEWSDDTQMAVCIARVSATGADLTDEAALDEIAQGFVRWFADGPADIGNQTRVVLGSVSRAGSHTAATLTAASEALHERTGRTAGNGALMRTAVVGLSRLEDREATADATRKITRLTHADVLAADSCVLWSEAVRRAVRDGVLDLEGGLDLIDDADRRATWADRIHAAETQVPETFRPNGFTAPALQAAWSAIVHTGREVKGPEHVTAALHRAIGIGHDTDTVAAIAGGLLGARYGVSAFSLDLQRRVHGWPGMRARDLVQLAVLTARQGQDDTQGWPTAYREPNRPAPLAAPLPSDPGVLVGTYADLRDAAELKVDAIVSLCRVGATEVAPGRVSPADHVEVRLIDKDDPTYNPHLSWVLDDAAAAVAGLREEGRRVLLHCVHAHHRTPAVALRYLLARGVDLESAVAEVESAVGHPVDGLLWKEAQHVR